MSDGGSPQLKKSDSLEALMQELDNEIQGKPISEEKIKTKKTKKRKKIVSTSDKTPVQDVENSSAQGDQTKKTNNPASEIPEDIKEPLLSTGESNIQSLEELGSPLRKRPRSRSPPTRRNFFNRRRQRNFPPQQPNGPAILPYAAGPIHFLPQMLPFNGQPFNPMFGPPSVIPRFYQNPLPPLNINTDSLPTATLAPLSPRSAAFVLENKAIIERRRRSPRRSYSRSPSRSPIRSLSPRRSPRWSISPRRSPPRWVPLRKRSLTPKRKSLSPRRKSLSPRRKSDRKSVV